MAKTAKRRRKRTTGTRRAGAGGQGRMWPWYAAGIAVVAGIALFENRPPAHETGASAVRTASIQREVASRPRAVAVEPKTAVVEPRRAIPLPGARPAETVEEKPGLPPFSGKWFICTTQTDYCVLTGDTVLYAGRKVRLADIDAPAIADARCDAERLLGGDAKLRLREILSEGDVTLVSAAGASGGRKGEAHVFVRNGKSVGQRLVSEGLARPWNGRHGSWCG